MQGQPPQQFQGQPPPQQQFQGQPQQQQFQGKEIIYNNLIRFCVYNLYFIKILIGRFKIDKDKLIMKNFYFLLA